MSANIYLNDPFTVIPAKDTVNNTTFADVIGNKTDVAAATADVVSVIGLLRYIIANMDSDADVAALLGAKNTAAHTGAVDDVTTMMGYVKQLITDERLIQTDLGDASAGTLGSIYAILGNPATSLATQIAAIGAVTAVLPNSGALTSLAQDSTVAKAASIGTITNSGGTATIGGVLGDVANNSIATRLTQLQSELSGTAGIASFPAAAAAANNVSLAEVIRFIQENLLGTIVNAGGTATVGGVFGDFANVTLVSRLGTITTDTEKIYDVALGVSPTDGSLASFVATGGTSLGTRLPVSKSLYDVAVVDTKIKKLINEAEGAGAFPASVIDNSILAFILSKVANGDTSSYDNTTDSLEAISDAITAVNTMINTTDKLDKLISGADGGTVYPSQVVDNSILGIILTKQAGGDISDFDNSTDSLEAISDKITAVDTMINTTDKLDKLIAVADGGTHAYPDSVAQESILAYLMSKSANPVVTSFDNTSDSLEAISDAVTNASNGVYLAYTGVEHHINVATVDASATAWTQAAHRLFTVTGVIKAKVFGVVSETLVGAATLEVGVAGSTNCFIAQLADATTLATNDIFAGTTTATAIPSGKEEDYVIIANTDIDLLVGGANVTDGTITFYCDWIPVSSGATIVAAVWD